MSKKYLKQVPTLVVIGVTGFTLWAALSPEGAAESPPGASKPPAPPSGSDLVELDSKRNPFQIELPPEIVAAKTPPTAGTPAGSPDSKSTVLPDLSAEDDGPISEMKLGGIYIDGQARLAVIDRKVYAPGDQLKAADGSKLPYTVAEIERDRAVLRRGRRNFVLAFSNVPRAATVKAEARGGKPGTADDKAKAEMTAKAAAKPKGDIPAKGDALAKAGPGRSKNPGNADAAPGSSDTAASKAMILKLLSGAAGTASAAASAAGGQGSALGSLGGSINEQSLSAGLDALMGNRDDLDLSGVTKP